ncbi:hypothetical protein EDEG_02580 [Edhazardia aedis USNM 41457]|uniref:Uncharacterized protein n=1 Tax=Edhazardia aedis (strain USNM 41457) TaxID=1003232 RepID=J9DK96_EDHAE|nr:hypothetical protein EDEG_02580 [Edhazardia aedis USNM 41457]|eukprot:EJW03030.1 hypothetical protein EDEG_02580 [Edhazardia aedis USNM 41457]
MMNENIRTVVDFYTKIYHTENLRDVSKCYNCYNAIKDHLIKDHINCKDYENVLCSCISGILEHFNKKEFMIIYHHIIYEDKLRPIMDQIEYFQEFSRHSKNVFEEVLHKIDLDLNAHIVKIMDLIASKIIKKIIDFLQSQIMDKFVDNVVNQKRKDLSNIQYDLMHYNMILQKTENSLDYERFVMRCIEEIFSQIIKNSTTIKEIIDSIQEKRNLLDKLFGCSYKEYIIKIEKKNLVARAHEIFNYVIESNLPEKDKKYIFNLILELKIEEDFFDLIYRNFKPLLIKKHQYNCVYFIDYAAHRVDSLKEYILEKNLNVPIALEIFKRMEEEYVGPSYIDIFINEVSRILKNNSDSELGKLINYSSFISFNEECNQKLVLNLFKRCLYGDSSYNREMRFCIQLKNKNFSYYKWKAKSLFRDFYDNVFISNDPSHNNILKCLYVCRQKNINVLKYSSCDFQLLSDPKNDFIDSGCSNIFNCVESIKYNSEMTSNEINNIKKLFRHYLYDESILIDQKFEENHVNDISQIFEENLRISPFTSIKEEKNSIICKCKIMPSSLDNFIFTKIHLSKDLQNFEKMIKITYTKSKPKRVLDFMYEQSRVYIYFYGYRIILNTPSYCILSLLNDYGCLEISEIDLKLNYDSNNDCKKLLDHELICKKDEKYSLNDYYERGNCDLFDYEYLPVYKKVEEIHMNQFDDPTILTKSQIMCFLKKTQKVDRNILKNYVDNENYFEQALYELSEKEFIIYSDNYVLYNPD